MYVCINWGVLKWRYPQIIQFIVDFRMVDYKPAIGVPLFDGNHHISICIYIYLSLQITTPQISKKNGNLEIMGNFVSAVPAGAKLRETVAIHQLSSKLTAVTRQKLHLRLRGRDVCHPLCFALFTSL